MVVIVGPDLDLIIEQTADQRIRIGDNLFGRGSRKRPHGSAKELWCRKYIFLLV